MSSGFYARIHELCRGSHYPEMVDVYVKNTDGKPFMWATVHIDFFSDVSSESYERLCKGEEVAFWVSTTPMEDQP